MAGFPVRFVRSQQLPNETIVQSVQSFSGGTLLNIAWNAAVTSVVGVESNFEVSETGAVWQPVNVAFGGTGPTTGVTTPGGAWTLWRINGALTQLTGAVAPIEVPQSGAVT